MAREAATPAPILKRRRAARRWAGWALVAAATALSIWVVVEAVRLPSAERLRETLWQRDAPRTPQAWLPLWAINSTLQTSVRVWEDPAFYHHGALNYPEILRAAGINLRAGRYVRGASTITQQVVKNHFLSPEKTLRRKLREAILAHRLEQVLTKDEILAVYLNRADWGDGTRGAESASRRYFGKSAAQLEWQEAALLAGMLPNPRQTNPCAAPQRALQTRRAVLAKLLAYGELSGDDYARADAAPLAACQRPT